MVFNSFHFAYFFAILLPLYWLLPHRPQNVLLLAAIATTICVFLILMLQQWGFRQLELVIMLFVVVIGGCYAAEIFFIPPHWGSIAYHTVVPILDGKSIYLAVTMLGATVMPHVVYLHSGLVQPRVQAERARHDAPTSRFRDRLLRMELFDVILAMNGAWLVNSAMVVVAATAFAGRGMTSMSIESAHATLGPLVGPASAALFVPLSFATRHLFVPQH